jgi:probable HAF family extracellular repeat protein
VLKAELSAKPLATHDTRATEDATVLAGVGGQAGKPGAGFAMLTTLPSFGRGSEALAVNAAGTVVVGTASDRSGRLHAVRWTLQNGTWAISSMPWPSGATSAAARGVSSAGDAAGSNDPESNSHAILWPAAGGLTALGCLPTLGGSSCMPSALRLRSLQAGAEQELRYGDQVAAAERCSPA